MEAMMAGLALVLMMQVVISTKAGYVNDVNGQANIKAEQTVGSQTPIKTESGSFAEVLLNPGSYLRLGPDSEAVLTGVEFPNIAVSIRGGSALIEAAGFDKQKPLRVANGSLNVEIIDDGLYLFSDGKATVLEGKLRVSETKATYPKGSQLSKNLTYQSVKIGKREPTPLEAWSGSRADLIAKANTESANNLRLSPNVKMDSLFDVWLWNPGYNAYTFMPGYDFRSPYGYRYVTVRDVFVVPGFYYNSAPAAAQGGPVGTAAAPPVVATPSPAPAKKDSTSAGRSN